MIYRFDILASSNDEAALPHYVEGDVIVVEQQTAGRGQRGHSWESGVGLNLTLSALFEPTFLNPSSQFLLSEAVALGVKDMLARYGIVAKIKWTNDIYVGDKKLAGILIEHKLQGSGIARTIAGIGLNVNQTEFSAQLPNPVSMAQVAGREFDRDEVLERLNESLVRRYEQLRGGDGETLQKDYHRSLYRLDSQYYYALPDGTRFRGTIRGVAESGALAVEDEQGALHHYLFKEVEFVIAQG